MALDSIRPFLGLLCAVATAAGACSDSGRGTNAGARPENTGLPPLAWGDTITLEENADVMNVWPNVHQDRAGNFVVADLSESQVRVYEPSGKLLSHVGRRGEGPDEFNGVVSALSHPGGGLLIVDAQGKAARVPAGSSRVSETSRLPVHRVNSVSLVGDSLLVVGGRGSSANSPPPLLHVFDLETLTLRHSFFPPPAPLRDDPIEQSVGFVNTSVKGDTIAVVYSASDTVYLFRADGAPLAQLPLKSRNFRYIESRPPQRGSTIQELNRWASSFSLVTDVYWGPGGDFLVQYQDRDGTELRWRLTRITRDGSPVFDLVDTPRLLAPAHDGSHLYFVAPHAEVPNVWVKARLQ